MPRHTCPACGEPLDRVHRRRTDRALSVVYPVRRYECSSRGCGWTGLIRARATDAPNRPRMKAWMWLLVVLVSLAAALAFVGYLQSQRGPSETPDAAPAP